MGFYAKPAFALRDIRQAMRTLSEILVTESLKCIQRNCECRLNMGENENGAANLPPRHYYSNRLSMLKGSSSNRTPHTSALREG